MTNCFKITCVLIQQWFCIIINVKLEIVYDMNID